MVHGNCKRIANVRPSTSRPGTLPVSARCGSMLDVTQTHDTPARRSTNGACTWRRRDIHDACTPRAGSRATQRVHAMTIPTCVQRRTTPRHPPICTKRVRLAPPRRVNEQTHHRPPQRHHDDQQPTWRTLFLTFFYGHHQQHSTTALDNNNVNTGRFFVNFSLLDLLFLIAGDLGYHY